MLKSITRVSVLAALLLSLVVFAGDPPGDNRSAQVLVSVTVVRGDNTASPEAPVQRVQCTEKDGITLCDAAKPPQASTSESAQQPCTASEQGTICWY